MTRKTKIVFKATWKTIGPDDAPVPGFEVTNRTEPGIGAFLNKDEVDSLIHMDRNLTVDIIPSNK